MPTPVTPIEPPTLSVSAFMRRPGQPGSLGHFNGENASDFLEKYNMECELFSVNEQQRGLRFQHYCTLEVEEIVKILPGYETHKWDKLQDKIKNFYWQYDHPKNTPAALKALIRNSSTLPLAAYILKFTSITDALVGKGTMCEVDQVNKLLEGLDERMRLKVIELCTTKGWRVTDEDVGEESKFNVIGKFLKDKARTAE